MDKITHFRHDEAASPSAPASESEKTPVPTDLLPWLGQAAYLLNLYLNGYYPKDVARNLIEKIKYNWPHMFFEPETITGSEQAAGEGATPDYGDAHIQPCKWCDCSLPDGVMASCFESPTGFCEVSDPVAQPPTSKCTCGFLRGSAAIGSKLCPVHYPPNPNYGGESGGKGMHTNTTYSRSERQEYAKPPESSVSERSAE
jgi:hypothetical protein